MCCTVITKTVGFYSHGLTIDQSVTIKNLQFHHYVFCVPTFLSDVNVRFCVLAVPVFDRIRTALCPSIPCLPSSVVVVSADRRTCCDHWLVQVYVHWVCFCFLLDNCCNCCHGLWLKWARRKSDKVADLYACRKQYSMVQKFGASQASKNQAT